MKCLSAIKKRLEKIKNVIDFSTFKKDFKAMEEYYSGKSSLVEDDNVHYEFYISIEKGKISDFGGALEVEFVTVQNILVIDNLEYETLCKVFDHEHIHDTDRIIVKQKKFTYEEIETALGEYTALLAKIFSKNADFGEDGICLNDRGKVLELLNLMADDDYEKYDNTVTAIEEAIMHEQWWIEGFRKHLTWHGKDKRSPRYFNPEAKIETVFI